jgi:hypothetical protein
MLMFVQFTVVGVHSAKFDNEKDLEAIRNAVLRYDITHPVSLLFSSWYEQRFDLSKYLGCFGTRVHFLLQQNTSNLPLVQLRKSRVLSTDIYQKTVLGTV